MGIFLNWISSSRTGGSNYLFLGSTKKQTI